MQCKRQTLFCDGLSRTGRESIGLSVVRERIGEICIGNRSSFGLHVDLLARRALASSIKAKSRSRLRRNLKLLHVGML